MAEAGTLVQSTGGCPQNCGGPGATFSCVSRTGDCALRGWSKAANHNSGDWNERKYTRMDQSGNGHICHYATTDQTCADLQQTYRDDYGGYATWNVATNEIDVTNATLTISYWRWDEHSGSPSCGDSGVGETGPVSGPQNAIPSGFSSFNCSSLITQLRCDGDLDSILPGVTFVQSPRVFTSPGDLSWTVDGAAPSCSRGYLEASCGATARDVRIGGSASASLSVPDTVHAAMVRASATSGTLCKTTAGTIGSTSARSTSALSITGSRSVRATISLTGLTVSQAYNITANINRYTAGGGGFVDTVQAVINFTADGASDTVDYDVPMNTDFDYEFASIASVVAA